MIPFPEDTEALELLPLNVHIFFRIFPAETAFIRLGQVIFLLTQFLVDLMLDGQAVTVPAGHINAVEARHILGLDHHILDNLVECRPQMDVAVGIGGTIMQDIDFPSFRNIADLLINVYFLPHFQHLRFFFREIGSHGKVGFRKIQTVFVVHRTLLKSCLRIGKATTDIDHFQIKKAPCRSGRGLF